MKGFLEIGNQYLRLEAVTRLAEERIPGSPQTLAYCIHFSDGGFISVSELEYKKVKDALMPPARKLRTPTKEVAR
jgi:hypothetical protein